MKKLLRLGKYKIGFIFEPIFIKTFFVYGMTSDVFLPGKKLGMHVTFWDFTEKDLQKIKESLKFIRRRKNLGVIYLFQSGSRKSYRAICLDKLPLAEMVRVICETPGVDLAFIKWTMLRRRATIRITPKKEEEIRFIGALGYDSGKREKSLAHALVLENLFGIPAQGNLDKSEKVRYVHYETVDD
jgi:hypothetical protein